MKLQNYVLMKLEEIKVQQADQAIKITEMKKELLLIQKELSQYENSLPKAIVKTNTLVKKPDLKNISTKIIKNENNLFTKYSITIFRDIFQFFTIYEIKALRLVCKATNQLCEQSLWVLLKLRAERKQKIFAAVETIFQQPQYINLQVVNDFLQQNRKKILEKNNNQFSKILEFITLIYQMSQPCDTKKQNTLVNFGSAIQKNANLFDWYKLSDLQIKKLKQLIRLKFLQYDFSEFPQMQILQQYITNLQQFVLNQDYRLMSEVHNLDQSVNKLDAQIAQLNKFSFQYDKNRNKLPKIQLLDNIFFENILLFCEYEDWKKIRFVCKFFNFKFRQNIIKLCWMKLSMNNQSLEQLFKITDGYKIPHLEEKENNTQQFQQFQQFQDESESNSNNFQIIQQEVQPKNLEADGNNFQIIQTQEETQTISSEPINNDFQIIQKQEEPQPINQEEFNFEDYDPTVRKSQFERVETILKYLEILNFYKNFGL